MFETGVIVLALMGISVTEGISAGTGMAAVFITLSFSAAALWKLIKKDKPGGKALGLKAAAYLVLVALLFGLNVINGRVGAGGAEQIASACEAYKTKTGGYPDSLEKLVPDYLKNIPPAKISLRWSRYWLTENKIIFVREPGVAVYAYDLSAKKWGFIPANKISWSK